MIDKVLIADDDENSELLLLDRLDNLERQAEAARKTNEQRVILAEMKVEAMRAGMVDLDGLQFLDLGQISLGDDGSFSGGADLIARLAKNKPWLFVGPSTSSTAKVPASRQIRPKMAMDMTDDEYRVAREKILRSSTL